MALNEPLIKQDVTFWTALSNILSASEFDSVVEKLSCSDSFVGKGSLNDGVLLTGQAYGLARKGYLINTTISVTMKLTILHQHQ